MIGSTNSKIILTDEPLLRAGEPAPVMTFGSAGRSISVPALIQGPDAEGRMAFAPENARLANNVFSIGKAIGAGLRITMIAAADQDWGIGLDGRLPWRRPDDLRHFRRRTMNGRLLMGRTTYEGLPATLDGRDVRVLSSASHGAFSSIDGALAALAAEAGDEILVAGGAAVYAAALPYCTHAEVTRIPGTHGCDAFMPDLRAAGWTLVSVEPLGDDLEIEHWERRA